MIRKYNAIRSHLNFVKILPVIFYGEILKVLKISLYVWVHIKTIPWKLSILNLRILELFNCEIFIF